MADSSGSASHPLSWPGAALSRLIGARDAPLGVKFYAALRQVECLYRDRPRLSEASEISQEPVRIGQDPSLAFCGSALSSLRDGTAHTPPRLALSFFGMYGPFGPLPTHLTQHIDDQQRHRGDGTLIGFLNVFHHRLASLLYRAWANSQPTINLDRPESDRFARHLGAIVGHLPSDERRKPSELDYVALFCAVHFAGRTRHDEGLAKVLQACFAVPAMIEAFFGHWLNVPEEYCWVIPGSEGECSLGVLGESTRVGTQVWDRQSRFRVVLGPLDAAEYRRFLPGSPHLQRLYALVRRYAGPELQWDIRLVLREPDRRAAVLGVAGAVGLTANLGESDGGVRAFEDLVIDPTDHITPELQHD